MLLSHFPVGRKKKVILFQNSQCKKRTEFLKRNQLHAVENTEQLYSKLPTTPFKISGGYFSAVTTGQRTKIWMKPLVIFMCQAAHFLVPKYSFKKVFSVKGLYLCFICCNII